MNKSLSSSQIFAFSPFKALDSHSLLLLCLSSAPHQLMSKMVKVIAGLMGGSVASGAPAVSSPSSLQSLLGILQKHNVSEIDTARVYNNGKSEETLGQVAGAANKLTIATKVPGFTPHSLTYDKVLASCDASLKGPSAPEDRPLLLPRS